MKHHTISQLANNFDGVLLDAYGVFWAGNAVGPLPGALECMADLVSRGKIVGILSNTSQPAEAEERKIAAHGLIKGTHFHFFVTAGGVARSVFQSQTLPFPTPHKQYYLFSPPHPHHSLPHTLFHNSPYKVTSDIHSADFIYITVPHIDGVDQTDTTIFEPAVQAIADYRLPMVCTNPDILAEEGNPPRFVVRQGAIAALYEKMGGQVFYIGKPHPAVYDHAMTEFKKQNIHDKLRILMIGDTPETDARGARRYGMMSALVTETGMLHHRLSQRSDTPYVLPQADTPHFFIPRLSL